MKERKNLQQKGIVFQKKALIFRKKKESFKKKERIFQKEMKGIVQKERKNLSKK